MLVFPRLFRYWWPLGHTLEGTEGEVMGTPDGSQDSSSLKSVTGKGDDAHNMTDGKGPTRGPRQSRGEQCRPRVRSAK